MGNTDNINTTFAHEIKNDVLTLKVTEIARLHVGTGFAVLRVFGQPEKTPIKRAQIRITLIPTPLLQRIAGNGA